MKLFLSSAGLRDEFKEDFLKYINKDPQDCRIAFIPTACDPEPDKSYVKWTTDQFEAAGFPWYEVDLKGENAESLRKKLKPADIIVVNGGNTFYLLDQARKSGFINIIRDLLDEGKVYFGISAGSYLACPTIEAAHWKHLDDPDVAKLDNLNALGLVDFLIVAHYTEKWNEAVLAGVATTKYPVIAITDQQAMMVEDEKVRAVGSGEVLTFNNFKEAI